VREAAVVIETIRQVKAKGVAVILISHRMQDILDVCDRAVLIAEGRSTVSFGVRELKAEEITEIILRGRMGKEPVQ
jgi:simple sugar transport system ATP-binding protein